MLLCLNFSSFDNVVFRGGLFMSNLYSGRNRSFFSTSNSISGLGTLCDRLDCLTYLKPKKYSYVFGETSTFRVCFGFLVVKYFTTTSGL